VGLLRGGSIKMFNNPIGKYLSIAHRAYTSLIDNVFQEKYNLSHGQVIILLNIYKNEGMSQNDLCSAYKLDKAGVGRIIKKLEEKNLILRKYDPKDKRKKNIYLSHKAKDIKTEFIKTIQSIESKARESLSKEEIKNLINTLKHVHHNIDIEDLDLT